MMKFGKILPKGLQLPFQRNRAKPEVEFDLPKAKASDFIGRYREIISDPLNLLIEKHPRAGHKDADNLVTLHNGNKVPASGPYAYYDNFSNILIANRGVHEPLEEFCFQELLKIKPPKGAHIIELGAFWAHYSMWFLQSHPDTNSICVEPLEDNIESGRQNFTRHGLTGTFIQDKVGKRHFEIDAYMKAGNIPSFHLVHCDIQGFEAEMLEGATSALSARRIEYLFISTHSNPVHNKCLSLLEKHSYAIEVNSGFSDHSTCFDGLIVARAPKAAALFKKFRPMGRKEAATARPDQLLAYLDQVRGNLLRR